MANLRFQRADDRNAREYYAVFLIAPQSTTYNILLGADASRRLGIIQPAGVLAILSQEPTQGMFELIMKTICQATWLTLSTEKKRRLEAGAVVQKIKTEKYEKG